MCALRLNCYSRASWARDLLPCILGQTGSSSSCGDVNSESSSVRYRDPRFRNAVGGSNHDFINDVFELLNPKVSIGTEPRFGSGNPFWRSDECGHAGKSLLCCIGQHHGSLRVRSRILAGLCGSGGGWGARLARLVGLVSALSSIGNQYGGAAGSAASSIEFFPGRHDP